MIPRQHHPRNNQPSDSISLPVSHYDAGLATVTHSPAEGATEATNDTSTLPNPTPQSSLNGGAASQSNKSMTIVPTAMVPDSLSPPSIMPANSSALTEDLHLPRDSAEKNDLTLSPTHLYLHLSHQLPLSPAAAPRCT